jgi:hypothetical protein
MKEKYYYHLNDKQLKSIRFNHLLAKREARNIILSNDYQSHLVKIYENKTIDISINKFKNTLINIKIK